MKKVLSIISLMAVLLTANAQGLWQKHELEADELKGQKAETAYIYTNPDVGSFICWGFENYQIRLISEKAQFDITAGYSSMTGSYAFVKVLVGIYDDNDKLLEKFEMGFDREDNKANHFIKATTSRIGHKKMMKKIFAALQSGSGYVRMVAPRYNTTDFDLKITPYME